MHASKTGADFMIRATEKISGTPARRALNTAGTEWASGLRLSDAHAHITSKEDLKERRHYSIPTLFSAGTPKEAEEVFQLVKKGSPTVRHPAPKSFPKENSAEPYGIFLPTCGLHPWHAAAYSLEEMLPYLTAAPIIGEIGMDSVWCDIPLALQEEVFRAQLRLACEQNKPVILHTKGQERQIASILKEYPNHYLVHWYSSEEAPDDYLALDCYFSIGPDVWWNPAVQQTAVLIPQNRLLIETDGLEAVRWAFEAAPPAESAAECSLRMLLQQKKKELLSQNSFFPYDSSVFSGQPDTAASSLFLTLQAVASLRKLSPEETSRFVLENLRQFLRYASISIPV